MQPINKASSLKPANSIEGELQRMHIDDEDIVGGQPFELQDNNMNMNMNMDNSIAYRAPSPSTISTASSGSPLVRSSSSSSSSNSKKNSNNLPMSTSRMLGKRSATNTANSTIHQQKLKFYSKNNNELQPCHQEYNNVHQAKHVLGHPSAPAFGSAEKQGFNPTFDSQSPQADRKSHQEFDNGHSLAKDFAYRAYRFNESFALRKPKCINFFYFFLALICIMTILVYRYSDEDSDHWVVKGFRIRAAERLVADADRMSSITIIKDSEEIQAKNFCYLIGKRVGGGDIEMHVLSMGNNFDETLPEADPFNGQELQGYNNKTTNPIKCQLVKEDQEKAIKRDDDFEYKRKIITSCRENSGFPKVEVWARSSSFKEDFNSEKLSIILNDLEVGRIIFNHGQMKPNKKIQLSQSDFKDTYVRIKPCESINDMKKNSDRLISARSDISFKREAVEVEKKSNHGLTNDAGNDDQNYAKTIQPKRTISLIKQISKLNNVNNERNDKLEEKDSSIKPFSGGVARFEITQESPDSKIIMGTFDDSSDSDAASYPEKIIQSFQSFKFEPMTTSSASFPPRPYSQAHPNPFLFGSSFPPFLFRTSSRSENDHPMSAFIRSVNRYRFPSSPMEDEQNQIGASIRRIPMMDDNNFSDQTTASGERRNMVDIISRMTDAFLNDCNACKQKNSKNNQTEKKPMTDTSAADSKPQVSLLAKPSEEVEESTKMKKTDGVLRGNVYPFGRRPQHFPLRIPFLPPGLLPPMFFGSSTGRAGMLPEMPLESHTSGRILGPFGPFGPGAPMAHHEDPTDEFMMHMMSQKPIRLMSAAIDAAQDAEIEFFTKELGKELSLNKNEDQKPELVTENHSQSSTSPLANSQTPAEASTSSTTTSTTTTTTTDVNEDNDASESVEQDDDPETLKAKHRVDSAAQPDELERDSTPSIAATGIVRAGGLVRQIIRGPKGIVMERQFTIPITSSSISQRGSSFGGLPEELRKVLKLGTEVSSPSISMAQPIKLNSRMDDSIEGPQELTPSLFARSAQSHPTAVVVRVHPESTQDSFGQHIGIIGRILSELTSGGFKPVVVKQDKSNASIDRADEFDDVEAEVEEVSSNFKLPQMHPGGPQMMPAEHQANERISAVIPTNSFEEAMNSMEDKMNNFLGAQPMLGLQKMMHQQKQMQPINPVEASMNSPPESIFTSPSSPLFGFPSTSLMAPPAAGAGRPAPTSGAAKIVKISSPPTMNNNNNDQSMGANRQQRSFHKTTTTYHSNHEIARPFLNEQQAQLPVVPVPVEQKDSRSMVSPLQQKLGPPASIVMGRRLDDFPSDDTAQRMDTAMSNAHALPLSQPGNVGADSGALQRAELLGPTTDKFRTIVV